jgi:LysR family transcriptional regulator, regulator for bpeEF and oprC
MDQLSAMRAFIRVVETGNFSRAAEALRMPKATVSTLIQGLESHLQTKLLNRTTRRVMVTTDGALYYERAVQIVSDLEELDSSLSTSHGLASGRLRVEMAGAFADWIVIPALCDFYQKYPDIRIDLGVGDRTVDYLAENVDCALRAGTPADQSLIARRVAEVALITCASPLYLERFGAPQHPRDIEKDHYCVNYLRAETNRILPLEFRKEGESELEIDGRYIVSVNDARSYMTAVSAGLGIAQLPLFMIGDALETGELVQLCPDWNREPLPLYVVYPPTRHLSNKVRVFVDWLAKLLGDAKLDRLP